MDGLEIVQLFYCLGAQRSTLIWKYGIALNVTYSYKY